MTIESNKPRICMAGSLYVLTFYLLTSSYEDIKRTIYCVDSFLPESARKNLPRTIYFNRNSTWIRNKYLATLYGWYYRHIKHRKFLNANIYGLDFYWWLLRGLKTNYIEDCPNVLDIWEGSSLFQVYQNRKKESQCRQVAKDILFGDYFQYPVGTSKNTICIHTSFPYDKVYHKGKDKRVYNLQKEWNNSSVQKQNEILRILNIERDTVKQLMSKQVILLTQPMSVDGIMSESEQIDTYRRIIDSYGEENVLIKTHPRDHILYKALFPKALTFDMPVPMQFLVILGAKFNKVATINSSSALSFGTDVDIDWWAEKMDYPRLGNMGFLSLTKAKESLSDNNGKK